MAEKEKKSAMGFLKKVFSTPREEEDYEYREPVSTNRSNYETMYGDMVRPIQESGVQRSEEDHMRQTSIKSDMSAFSSSGIEMELMRPNFSFENGLSLESISAVSKDIIGALKENKTVLLDLYDLGDDERTVITYVVLGAVNALGYTITNVRDHLMFTLTPEGISVAQDERVRIEGDEGLRYSNDYR